MLRINNDENSVNFDVCRSKEYGTQTKSTAFKKTKMTATKTTETGKENTTKC